MTKSQKQIGEQIVELLGGHLEQSKRGRWQRRYLRKGSAEEKHARRALAKVLRTAKPLDLGLRWYLADLVDPDTDTPRRIVFENRGAGRQSNADIEKQVAESLWREKQAGGKIEAAIKLAKKDFGLERSSVKKIWRVWKPILEREYRIHGPLTTETMKKYWPDG
jgi:hypothetical protein